MNRLDCAGSSGLGFDLRDMEGTIALGR
jgi:hypothetical protein